MKLLEEAPIIAAIKNEEGLERSLKSECKIVFVVYGTICDLPAIVSRLKEHDKIAIVHADLILGFSAKEVVVDYIKSSTQADGIVSTKVGLLKRAKEQKMIAIQRAFAVDSMALELLRKQLSTFEPDAVEIMPGVMPRVLSDVRKFVNVPLITGGLISDKKDVMAALMAGADAISATKEDLWYL